MAETAEALPPHGNFHDFPAPPAMPDRTAELQALAARRILILDGAMGTMIQRLKLVKADYRGTLFADWPRDLKGSNDLLTLTRPEAIREIHAQYLEAGADILETNTFNANAVSMADYGMEVLVHELNYEGARLARAVADEFSARTPDRPRFVAGVLGPTSRTLSISPDVNDPGFRNVSWEALVDTYYVATDGLVKGGDDLLLIETVFDTLNAKAVFAIHKYFEDTGETRPIVISGTSPTHPAAPCRVKPSRRSGTRYVTLGLSPSASTVPWGRRSCGRTSRRSRTRPTCWSPPTQTLGYPTPSESTTRRPRRWRRRSANGPGRVCSTSSAAAVAQPRHTSAPSPKRSATARPASSPGSNRHSGSPAWSR